MLASGTRPSSIVGTVVLALRVQDALPVVRLPRLLGVGVDQHLDVAPEEGAAHIENGKVLLLDREAGEGADDRWGGAPIDELSGRHLEGGAMQRANNDVANDVSTLAHGRPDVRAEVAHAEELAAAILAN